MMFKNILSGVLIFLVVSFFNISPAKAESSDKDKAVLKTQEAVVVAPTVKVDLANSLAKLKIKGRWAAGIFNSGKAGSYPSVALKAPEAKIQFAFEPDEVNKVILRMNLNNATFNNLDYYYIESDLKSILNLPFSLSSRLGKIKMDFGEETWSNNPVESVLASNSVANVSGYDEGLQFSGKLGKTNPFGYSLAVTNKSIGTGADISFVRAFTGKISYLIIDPLNVSASYYNSGSLKTANSELAIAGLASRPSGAVNWSRDVWEVDLRYDFEKGKTLNPLAYSDSRAILRLAYGNFNDTVTGGAKRSGQFGYLEGTYNLTEKIYLASRLSYVGLNGGATASLNSVTANGYQRYSFGLGYRLTGNTLLKLSYDVNNESGTGISNADNNLLSAILATQF